MKDYKKLEERINKEKEITIASITELGYSRYDINQFIEAGILSRTKRGIYKYLPELEIVHQETETVNAPVEVPTTEIPTPVTEEIDSEQLFQYVNQGIYNLIKKQNETAIELFNSALELKPNHDRALIGLAGAYVFLNDYQKAYEYLIAFYNTRDNNLLLSNIYYYLLILKQHINIDEQLLTSIKEELENNKTTVKKQNANFKKLHKALEEDNYLEALKYANYSISIDVKAKKYHLTNHIYKALIIATLKLKGIDPYEGIAKYKEEKGETFIRPESKEENVAIPQPVLEEPEEIVVVPETKVEDTIKTNLLLEAINSNNYDLALTLLEQEQIDNPLEVIKVLLNKLSLIKGLLTSPEPIKVVATENVRVVKQEDLLEDIHSIEPAKVEESTLESQSPVVEETSPLGELIEESIAEKTPTPEELIDMAYKAYKNAYHTEQFDEASKNLRRYEFLSNSNGLQRNINYHRIRIEQSKKDYEQSKERYIQKKALAQAIFDLKKEKRYDAALAAIREYKTLGGIRNDLVLICEAEIYYLKNDFAETQRILSVLASTCEEPSFYILSSKIAFKNRRYQDALQYCQAYNSARPNQSPSNYQLMGDCYTKLGKNGKAIKAYRKAEEIAASYGTKQFDLGTKIAKQEMIAEFKKEERDARSLGKKK